MQFIEVGYARATEPGDPNNYRYLGDARLHVPLWEWGLACRLMETAYGCQNQIVKLMLGQPPPNEPGADYELKGEVARQVVARICEAAANELTDSNSCWVPIGDKKLLRAAGRLVAQLEYEQPVGSWQQPPEGYTGGAYARTSRSGDRADWAESAPAWQAA